MDSFSSKVSSRIFSTFGALVQPALTNPLARNFNWSTRVSTKSNKKRRVAEAVVRRYGVKEAVSSNKYVSQMLAASLGMKMCDVFRRILLYTKSGDSNKGFYAVCRGLFPIHELCGTMTAIALAKRDVLGVDMPLWKMLAPAVVIHGMANFRGMKVRNTSSPEGRDTRVLSVRSPFALVDSHSSNGMQLRLGLRCSCLRLGFQTRQRSRSFSAKDSRNSCGS